MSDETLKTERTLADDLREEEELARRRFVHATRPKYPMSMEEAMKLHERMLGKQLVKADQPSSQTHAPDKTTYPY
jgi:hypothetical protein